MEIGDLVRIRFRKIIPHQLSGPPKFDEWWEEGGIVIKEYRTWEKIVTVYYKGSVNILPANDVQLISRARRKSQ